MAPIAPSARQRRGAAVALLIMLLGYDRASMSTPAHRVVPVMVAVTWLLVAGNPSPLGAPSAPPVPAAAPAKVAAAPAPAKPRVSSVALKRGDNLVSALGREGIDSRTGFDIAAALRQSGANLRRIKPDQSVEIKWNLNGEPVAVTYEPSPWLGFAVISTERGWTVQRNEVQPDVRVEAIRGAVDHSLFQAIEEGGGSAQLVFGLVDIFASEFDFAADAQPGDRLRMLVEKRYAGEDFVDFGRIIAAQYLSDARMLTAIGFERNHTFGHYDLEGRSLRKTFLKSPLEFTRITDAFSYARLHPILGGVRPHLAVDYGAPLGTPVHSVAAGVVVDAGWQGGYGNSVRVRHEAGYETMYNHLARLGAGVRKGAYVRQRQVVGFVGSTGLSTGPHLDFRVARHGLFVNPLTERFLPGEPLAASERPAFLRHARALVARLEAEAGF